MFCEKAIDFIDYFNVILIIRYAVRELRDMALDLKLDIDLSHRLALPKEPALALLGPHHDLNHKKKRDRRTALKERPMPSQPSMAV